LAQLPEHLQQPDQLGLSAALVGRLGPEEVAPLASRLGWRLDSEAGTITRLRRGPLRLELVWGRFADVVQQSDLVLSMTGTAAEQAVGLGKPVLQLVGSGPQFTDNFAEAQRRLLGPSLFCAAGRSGSAEQREGTARLLAQLLGDLQRDGTLAERCQRNGLERIGAQRHHHHYRCGDRCRNWTSFCRLRIADDCENPGWRALELWTFSGHMVQQKCVSRGGGLFSQAPIFPQRVAATDV
jgi:uncharacterized protein (TIGR03492 family)